MSDPGPRADTPSARGPAAGTAQRPGGAPRRVRRARTVTAALALALSAVLLWGLDGGGPGTRPRADAFGSAATAARGPGQDAVRPAGRQDPPVGPARLRVPSLAIDAPLIDLGLGPDGEISVPPYSAPGEAGWFAGSVAPGDPGTAVIIGHVDTREGPAVFWNLSALRPGDRIDVQGRDGRIATFTVDRVTEFSRAHFPAEQVYGPLPGAPAQLRLITCGGPYDHRRGQYTGNTVVFAHLSET